MAMKEHGKLTERQFAGIIANTLLGAGTLLLPRDITAVSGTGAWLSVLIGGFISIILLLLLINLGLRFPEETIMEYGMRLTNKWIGGLIGIAFCTYWLFITGIIVRIFSLMLVSSVLFRTPLEVIVIAMLLTVLYFSRSDLQIVGRVNEIYFVFVILFIMYALFLGLREINLIRVLPLTGGKGIMPILKGGLKSFFSFLGFEIVALFIPSLTTQKLAYNYSLKGIVTPLVAYIITMIVSVGVFGVEELQTLVWPTLELIKVTPFPGLLLERMEAVFIAFWVVAIFTTAANVYYASVVGFTQIFKLKEHKTLTLTLLPLAYLSAILPDNLHDVFEYVDIVTKFAAGLIITTIIIYFAAIFIKGRKGDERS